MPKVKDLTQRLAEQEQWKSRNNVQPITYDNLPEENKRDPNILPFRYKKPFPQEIEEIKEERKDLARGKEEGIMQVATSRGDREYLISVLSRYYTPRDLYYKNIKELNQMLQMHLTESGGLI